MTSEDNLIVDKRVKKDILSYTPALQDQIIEFMERLAAKPFSPEILNTSIDCHDGSFYHRLPSGCFVAWEIVDAMTASFAPSILPKDGIVVRVTLAKFDFAPRETTRP